MAEPAINDKLSAPKEQRYEPRVPPPAPASVPNSELQHGGAGAVPLGGPAAAPEAEVPYVAPPRPKDLWAPGQKVILIKGPAPGDIITQ
jgi:hypothetical protein